MFLFLCDSGSESESEYIQTITKEILKVKLKCMHLFVPKCQVVIDSCCSWGLTHCICTLRIRKYLPIGLRLLDWPDYSFPLPSTFCPQLLVELNMPYSCIALEEPFRQV
ncbi:hypothetical protein SO802_020820 [Lithocarpus litseifolius]|uniref:Uncharacterized protein n=1 Tax=Lithocarpus litseifolius TaxID=425828 RepID=A0AAW2CFW8_9ROSI